MTTFDTWPVPKPEDARERAIQLIDAMIEAGSIDEYTSPDFLEPLFRRWAKTWAEWERDGLEAVVRTAATDENFLQGLLDEAEAKIRTVRTRVSDGDHRDDSDPGFDGVVIADDDAEPDTSGWFRTNLNRFGLQVVLVVLVLADSYGFWQTLTRIVQRDTVQLALFVLALAIGAVTAARLMGRLWSRYASGRSPAALPWLGVLAVAWLALGVTMFWLRAHPPATVQVGAAADAGVFEVPGGATAAAASDGNREWVSTWGMAALLLMLYVLSGLIAMTDAARVETVASARFGHWWAELGKHVRERADLLSHLTRNRLLGKDAKAALDDGSYADASYAAARALAFEMQAYIAMRLGDPSSAAAVPRDADIGPDPDFGPDPDADPLDPTDSYRG